MSRLLFVVHGMGVHQKNWAAPTIKHLVALPTTYQYSWFTQHGALDTHVDIVPITYDGVFTQYLDDWSKSSTALQAFAVAHGVALPQFLTWLSGSSETEKNFFWSHVVDVLMYRLFAIVTAEVRLRVREAMVAALTPRMLGGNPLEASVVAHSLGTSVTHDALALLATQPIRTAQGDNRSFMLENFTFANVFMIANVSRVLETSPRVYESAVHPITTDPATAYITNYCNCRHEFDPFPAVRPFNRAAWGAGYQPIEHLAHILQFNTHDLDHYLEDPRVHVPLLRQLIGEQVVTDAEFATATTAYLATPEPDCIAQLRTFKARVQQLIAEYSGATDPQDVLMAFIKALAAAQEAKDACV